jgi:hypothetical protein
MIEDDVSVIQLTVRISCSAFGAVTAVRLIGKRETIESFP